MTDQKIDSVNEDKLTILERIDDFLDGGWDIFREYLWILCIIFIGFCVLMTGYMSSSVHKGIAAKDQIMFNTQVLAKDECPQKYVLFIPATNAEIATIKYYPQGALLHYVSDWVSDKPQVHFIVWPKLNSPGIIKTAYVRDLEKPMWASMYLQNKLSEDSTN